jgi:hypothetical protein
MNNYKCLILFSLLTTCVTVSAQDNKFCGRQLSSEDLQKYNSIKSAFENNNLKLKEEFFDEWFKLSKNLTVAYKSSDSITNALNYFFKDIYFPDNKSVRTYCRYRVYDSLNKKTDTIKIQWNGCFIDAEYFVVQSKIEYRTYTDSIFSRFFLGMKCNTQESIYQILPC